MNKEEIKQEPNDGLIARILGGTPTILQKVFFILMAFSLILWPLGCYVSIFPKIRKQSQWQSQLQ